MSTKSATKAALKAVKRAKRAVADRIAEAKAELLAHHTDELKLLHIQAQLEFGGLDDEEIDDLCGEISDIDEGDINRNC